MFHIACKGCGAWTLSADASDPDTLLKCGCCAENHHHGMAANACPGAGNNHLGAACPVGADCLVHTPAGSPCPGGHCAKGVPGCTVCRPITITLLPGATRVGMA